MESNDEKMTKTTDKNDLQELNEKFENVKISEDPASSKEESKTEVSTIPKMVGEQASVMDQEEFSKENIK